MQIRSQAITIDTYLKQFNYKPIRDDGENILIQLHNLKLLQIQHNGSNNYAIQEVTQGKERERWEDISIETVIKHIQMLEGGNDSFSKIWHIDDVLSLDSTLTHNHARLVLQMAMDNHDPAIGINQKVLGKYIKQVVKMKRDGIII